MTRTRRLEHVWEARPFYRLLSPFIAVPSSPRASYLRLSLESVGCIKESPRPNLFHGLFFSISVREENLRRKTQHEKSHTHMRFHRASSVAFYKENPNFLLNYTIDIKYGHRCKGLVHTSWSNHDFLIAYIMIFAHRREQTQSQ